MLHSRAERRRALRRVARAPARREADRRRRALGDLRAAREPRRDHRRRGARGRATSRARRRAITRAKWRSCARAPRARSWCSAARRRVSRAGRMRRRGSTRCSRCRSAWARAKLPTVEVVDLRHSQRPVGGKPIDPSRVPFNYVFSEPLEAALGERLQQRGAEHPAAQSPRICVVPAVRCVRHRARAARTAASRSRITAAPSGSSATTACTRSCRRPRAASAAAPP